MLVSTASDWTAWVVDSRAMHHMCDDREAFRRNSLGPAPATVRLGDKSVSPVSLQGSVTVNGVHLTALFIPKFRVSLLSVAQLDADGLQTTFSGGKCIISDHSRRAMIRAGQAWGLYWVESPGVHLEEQNEVSMAKALLAILASRKRSS